MEELIKALGIKNPTDKIRKHPKMLQLLEYNKLHDIYLDDSDENFIFTEESEDDDVYAAHENGCCYFHVNEDALITLLENINSLGILLNILKKSYILLGINYHALEYAKFFNIYNPEVLNWSPEAAILVDEEYLKYASVEWTEKILKNQEKVLEINDKTLTLKDNEDEESVDYIDSFLLNLVALKKAKDLGLLKEAIKKLSE